MKKDDTSKQRILNAATKLFAQNGYDGTSVRKICKEANANICMISYFWGGKQELFNGILEDLVEKQIEYAKTFLDFDTDTKTLPKSEQISLLYTILDKTVDFLYKNISNDLIIFILKEQHNPNSNFNSPVFYYLRKLLSEIFEKDMHDREMVYKTVFLLSQINSPRIMTGLTLKELKQETFSEKDIKIIKENVKFYVELLFKKAGIYKND